jgi:hypothetical protein
VPFEQGVSEVWRPARSHPGETPLVQKPVRRLGFFHVADGFGSHLMKSEDVRHRDGLVELEAALRPIAPDDAAEAIELPGPKDRLTPCNRDRRSFDHCAGRREIADGHLLRSTHRLEHPFQHHPAARTALHLLRQFNIGIERDMAAHHLPHPIPAMVNILERLTHR